MRSQAFDLLNRLESGIVFDKRIIARIHRARIHEVFPNQDAQRVTDVEEIVRRINAATPHAQHVEMRVFGRLEQTQGVVGIRPCLNHFLRDIIRALGIERHAIHLEIESATDAVRLIDHLESADARLDPFGIQHFLTSIQDNLKII